MHALTDLFGGVCVTWDQQVPECIVFEPLVSRHRALLFARISTTEQGTYLRCA